jgi:hypothetical protein
MYTRLDEIVDKKSNILSKILKVDPKSLKESKLSQSHNSGIDTNMIRNIQERINNRLFNLSIADYELMCGNKMISKMMSKVLNCDERQLKKFCKYINVFKENINSSPKSIKNKMISKISLNKLPEELRTQIVEKYKSLFPTKYVLRDWVPTYKINLSTLSRNPNAIDFLKANPKNIDWVWLSCNPNAIELLKKNRAKINWDNLSMNPNPEAIELLKANFGKIDWYNLSKNPNPEAIELLKAYPKKIKWEYLSENSNSNIIELLKEKIKLENNLSSDDLDDLPNYKKIDWSVLSANPIVIELLRADPEKIDWIDWKELSANPNAIELLKANQGKINWNRLSANPNAIELLKANQGKINWQALSANPNAFELLKKYPKKIDWEYASMNPVIFEAK